MITYKEAISEQMERLTKISNSIFLGQQVLNTDFYGVLNKVPKKKRIELPVCEELQVGMSIGLALENYLPISIFQRMDFLLRATDQIVNHLDKFKELTCGVYSPKILIFVTIGNDKKLDPGVQHKQNHIEAFKHLVSFPIFDVKTPKEVFEAFDYFISHNEISMIVVRQELL